MLDLGVNLALNVIWSEVSREFGAPVNIGAFLRPSLSVRTLPHDIQHVLATEGVVVRRDHPKLTGAIDWVVRNGDLRPVLPGVYAEPEGCDSIRTRIQAVMHWDPDGRLYHTGAEAFESDRWRQNLLVLNGWCVLRFTWTMIEDHPEKVLAMVRDAIKLLTAAAL